MTQEILVVEDTELLIVYETQQEVHDTTQQTVLLEEAIQGPEGAQGPRGLKGDPGAPGAGLPAGGAPGQIATKRTAADFDVLWTDPPQSAVWGNITGNLAAQADLQAALAAAGPVKSVNGHTGNVTLAASDVGADAAGAAASAIAAHDAAADPHPQYLQAGAGAFVQLMAFAAANG